jgi:class 3 adenylate cyclase
MTICSNCGAENDAGVKFCGECGSPLALICPTCGAANTAGRKFCGDCGAALASAPEPTATAAAAAAASPVAERRLVSVLFADLVGFTAASERDAEETRELLSRYFDACRRLVGLYGRAVPGVRARAREP